MDESTYITLLQIVVTAFTAILASSGFWAFINRKRNTTALTKKLLIGLAHDRIVSLSLDYIRRGCITQEEHENLSVFLFHPYEQMGGNGSVLRLMQEVDRLPIMSPEQTYNLEKEMRKHVK